MGWGEITSEVAFLFTCIFARKIFEINATNSGVFNLRVVHTKFKKGPEIKCFEDFITKVSGPN